MGQSVWINEQAAREIYLETVETAAVEGDASGVMNGFNRWGTKWCGEYGALQDGFLRGECGMEGAFITDMSAFSEYMPTPNNSTIPHRKYFNIRFFIPSIVNYPLSIVAIAS